MMEKNEELIHILDKEEIWETFKTMHRDKALGPDGLTVFFSGNIGR